VVGGGLAGLAAAWWLARAGHAPTLFEAAATPGFTAHNVAIEHGGTVHRIDVPLRVFYPGYYPTLAALYAELGIASEPVDYAATLCGPDRRPYFRYRNLRLGDSALGWLAPQDVLLGAPARRIVAGLLRLHREGRHDLQGGQCGAVSIADYLAQAGYPPDFVDRFVLPALCTVATCSTAAGREVPAAVVLDYMARGLARQAVRRVAAGADAVLAPILPRLAALHCAADVQRVRLDAEQVVVAWTDSTAGSRPGPSREARFDHAVLACPAPRSARLAADAGAAADAAVLGGFRYAPLEVLSHRDAALLPARQRDWSPVNLHLEPGAIGPEATIWLNRVQPVLRDAAPVFQTVQPAREPAPHLLLGRSRFERPLVDGGTAARLAELHALLAQPGRRIWYCGSYAEAGIPLLESAVASARRVVQHIGAASANRDR
jgi:predicted NAD/FAD-binding protein